MSLNTGGLDKTSQRGVWFPYLRWCKYLLPEGWTGYPPQPKSSFCLQHSLLLTVPFSIMYLSVNEIVSLPQVKIFISGVLVVQNQALRTILHIIILKTLPRHKKMRGGSQVHSRRGVFQLQGGADFSHEKGVPPSTPLVHFYTQVPGSSTQPWPS